MIETVVIQIFAFEFVTKLACCPDYKAYFRNVMNYVDFGAIFPWYIGLMLGGESSGTGVLRVLRLSRLLRVIRIGNRCAITFEWHA